MLRWRLSLNIEDQAPPHWPSNPFPGATIQSASQMTATQGRGLEICVLCQLKNTLWHTVLKLKFLQCLMGNKVH